MASKITWFDVCDWGIEGKGWTNTERYFDRLPAYAHATVPSDVWNLSRHSTGFNVRFATNSTAIHAEWRLCLDQIALPHMPATAVSGLDLYAKTPLGKWRWVGTGKPQGFPDNRVCLNYGFLPEEREYLLYMPLHNQVEKLKIGIESESSFTPLPPRHQRPIIFYGTSIVHGIAASRPGMCHTSIIGRRLDCPIVNLGFSGRAKMELALAELLAELNPAVYVIDCLPNMEPELVETRAEVFLKTLHTAKPEVPIVLVEDRSYPHGWIVPTLSHRNRASRALLHLAYRQLSTHETQQFHYVSGDSLLGSDGEATVDGTHPTDLGFMRFADVLAPVIKGLLLDDQ